jgi:hypothetical protein
MSPIYEVLPLHSISQVVLTGDATQETCFGSFENATFSRTNCCGGVKLAGALNEVSNLSFVGNFTGARSLNLFSVYHHTLKRNFLFVDSIRWRWPNNGRRANAPIPIAPMTKSS